jgi:capsular exopolysaccharide synthesis family protein
LATIAKRKWGWLVFGLLLGIAGGVAYWRYAPQQFVSRGEILVMRKGAMASVTSEASSPTEDQVNEDLLATHMRLIQSAKIVGSALEVHDLRSLPSIEAQLEPEETPEKYVIKHLNIQRGGEGQAKNAHMISISFQHTDATDAQTIVNAIIAEYRKFVEEKFKDVNLEAFELLRSAEQEMLAELTKAEKKYAEFRKSSPLLYKGEESSNIHRARFEQLALELAEAEVTIAEIKGRLETVYRYLKIVDENGGSDLSRLAVLDETSAERIGLLLAVERNEATSADFQRSLPLMVESARAELGRLAELKAEHMAMLLEYGENHPDVKRILAQIASLENSMKRRAEVESADDTTEPGEIAAQSTEGPSIPKRESKKMASSLTTDPKILVSAYIDFLKNDLTAIELRQKQLLEQSENAEQLARSVVGSELEDETLRTDVRRRQQLYDSLTDRLGELSLAKDYGGFIHEVIVDPEVGELIWPKLPVSLALGSLAGLVLGASGAALSIYRDTSFKSSDEIRKQLSIPVLADVPQLPRRLLRRSSQANEIAESIVTFHNPMSLEAEAFRLLRTQILSLQSDKNRVIQITSPKQGDGKSLISTNLAVSLAQAGKSVLLIDCDLRRPSIQALLGLPAESRLAKAARGALPFAQAKLLVPGVDNLSVLTSALPGESPELLEGRGFAKLIESAKQAFDVVLLDTPPLLPVADPCIIARHADAVVLAMNIVRTTKSQATWACELLNEVGANIIGVVVNGIEKSSSYGYQYHAYGRSTYTYNDTTKRSAKRPAAAVTST